MKQITRILVSISILLFLFQIDGVFAAIEAKSTVTDTAIEILNLIVGVLNFIVSPLIAFSGWLLSPDWTMGDIFGFRVVLHDMWVTISNITYFIYAIALIIMALASMFNVENYGVKKLLPRFALGIIMVPMTWWFVQATVSLANILTVSVIQIPFETLKKVGGNGNAWLDNPTIPKEFTYTESGSTLEVSTGKISLKAMMEHPSAGPFSMLNAFAYNIFSIQNIKAISNEEKSQIKAGVNIFNKLLYGLIVYIAFGFVIIALIAALFKRVILLWVYSMFSPLFSLAFFLPDELKKGLDLFDHKKFIGLAFVPVFVAGALAFGLVLLNLIINPIMKTDNCADASYCLKNIMGDEKASLTVKKEGGKNEIISTWEVGGITIIHKGQLNSATKEGLTGAMVLTSSIFGKVLFDILGILIIWMAVFGALKGSELTAKVVGSIESIGKKAGGMWKYAPIPGIPGGSISGMQQGVEKAIEYPKNAANKRFNESNFGQAVNRLNNITPDDINNNTRLSDLAKKINNGSSTNSSEVVNAVNQVRSASQSGLNSVATGMREIARSISGNDAIQKTMLDGKALKDANINNSEDLKGRLKLLAEGKLADTEVKAITAAFAGIGPTGSIDKDKEKEVLQRLNTPRGNSVDSQQSNNPSAPQPSYKDRVLNINNTNIILDKLDTDTDDTAKFKRIAEKINENYTGTEEEFIKLLKDLKVPDSEAEKISKEVAKVRNSSPKK